MSNCKCIRGKFKPIIKTEKGSVTYYDNSDWMDEYGVAPEKYKITVSSPHNREEETFFVSTSGPTELPLSKDEVYCIEFDNCGTLYTTYVPILPSFHCKLETMIVEAGSSDWSDDIYELANILNVIEVECDKEKIKELYKVLKQKYNSKNCCNGL